MSGYILLGLRILAIIALYAFLGTIFYLLWTSLKQDAQLLSKRMVATLDLMVCLPDKEDQLHHYRQNNIAIGRDPNCDCVLDDNTVSARHTRLTYHHSQWWVEDLLSTNGTRLNDETLQMPTVVSNGDTILCGQIKVNIII